MIPSLHWARNFTVTDDDIEFLTSLLLDRETPLSSADLARALIERRLEQEADALRARYQNARVYNPSQAYPVGQKIVFPTMDFQIAEVTNVRPGNNPDYGDFEVMSVAFDDDDAPRHYAAALKTPHKLSTTGGAAADALLSTVSLSVDEILAETDEDADIVGAVDERLSDSPELVIVAGKWFPRDLMIDVNDGHLFLADAVLDLANGGPMDADTILDQIGGLGEAARNLQVFSLNNALNEDDRFDEVGPIGRVMWYLKRVEPPEVTEPPAMLRYTDIEHDRHLMTDDQLALEAEIDDELSPLKDIGNSDAPIAIALIYPHRRVGTLPLNAKMRRVFPTARRTQRIWITLVDAQDNQEYQGWVVRRERYVFGLMPIYQKHKLPVGGFVSVRPGETPDRMIIDFRAHRPRTEWIRLITPKNGQISFENHKRAIGAEYDDLMILGAEDLAGVDALFTAAQQSRRNLTGILRVLLSELGRLTPQGTVHAKTLYSAVNVIRRCPPAPMFAALNSEPDFEHVGNHYWKITSTT